MMATGTYAVFRRELQGYFTSPLAPVFAIAFISLSGLFAFYFGAFFERGQADLEPFFTFHPWLFLFLAPAISMRLWADEHNHGTIELLLTLPIPPVQAVLGKFLAAWCFMCLVIALTAPMWATVNYLGNPDNGVIFTGYLASMLMAGAFLAVGSCISAANNNQITAFILTVVVCLVLLLAGFPMVLDFFREWAPQAIVDAIAGLSFLTHYESLSRGVVRLNDLVYFLLTIGCFLYATVILLDLQRGNNG